MLLRAGLRVLMYHKVLPQTSDGMTVSESIFQKQISFLEKNNFYFISIANVLECIHKKLPFPQKSVLVTFDDGYRSNGEFAFPYLLSKNIRPLLFVPTAFVGKTNVWDQRQDPLLTSSELVHWHKGGVDLGTHSHQHQNWTQLTSAQVDSDLQESFKTFQILDLPRPKALAYPYGSVSHRSKEAMNQLRLILKKNGVDAAFRIGNRVETGADPHLLCRLDVRGDRSFWDFYKKCWCGRLF